MGLPLSHIVQPLLELMKELAPAYCDLIVKF